MNLEVRRERLSESVSMALDQAAHRYGVGRALDSRDVLLALMMVDAQAEWERIWLEFASPEAMAIADVTDLVGEGDDTWSGRLVTGTCAIAIRATPIAAGWLQVLPAPVSVLALCLIADPLSAASLALTGGDTDRHGELLEAMQASLLGARIEGIESLLARSLTAARMDESKANRLNRLSEQLSRLHAVYDAPQAIPLCQQILSLITRDDDPLTWAVANATMAAGLTFHRSSDHAQDIRKAIACFEAALSVFSQAANPIQWANVHIQLSGAYSLWIEGNRADNLERSLEHAKRATRVGQGRVPQEFWAMLQSNLGGVYLDRLHGQREDNLKRAKECLETALIGYGSIDKPPQAIERRYPWAQGQTKLGLVYAELLNGDPAENIERAMDSFRRALQVFTRESFPCDFATVSWNLGDAWADRLKGERVANQESAITCYESAQQALVKDCAPDERPKGWMKLLHTLGTAYANRLSGDPVSNVQKATDFLEWAHRSFKPTAKVTASASTATTASQQQLDWAQILVGLGQVYSHPAMLGRPEYGERLEEAIHCFERARDIFDRDANPEQWAQALESLAITYADRPQGNRVANLQYAIALFDELEEAGSYDSEPMKARMLHTIGVIHADLAAADPRIDDREEHLWLAIDSLRKALEIFNAAHQTDRCQTCGRELGKVYADAGRWREAADAYLEAIEATEILYAASLLQESKEAELAMSSGLYLEAGYSLARAGDNDQAVRILEQGRSRALGESLARDRADLSKVTPSLSAEYKQAVKELRAIEELQRRFSISSTRRAIPEEAVPDTYQESAAELRVKARAAEERLRAVTQRIRQSGLPGFLTRPGLDTVAAAVTDDCPIAYLAVGLHGGVVLLLHRTRPGDIGPPDRAGFGIQAIPAADDSPTLLRRLWDLLITLDDDSSTEAGKEPRSWFSTAAGGKVVGGYLPGQREILPFWFDTALNRLLPLLGDQVIGPLAHRLRALGSACVNLIACPPLSLLPLHAAVYTRDGTPRRLLDDFEVTYAPSAQVLNTVRAIAISRAEKPLSFAGVAPSPPPGLAPLPFARAELKEAAARFRTSTSLFDNEATRDTLVPAAMDATHIHFASHGEFDVAVPMRSRLFLANGTELTLQDVLDARPFPNARLVVMSACRTAVSDINQRPDEYIGMPAGFLEAGTPGIVGALWKVPDLATALLMSRFYEYHLPDGPDQASNPVKPAAALRQAQLWLANATLTDLLEYSTQRGALNEIWTKSVEAAALESRHDFNRPFENPRYWAAFVFVGVW